MGKPEPVVIPFVRIGNRCAIHGLQVIEMPGVKKFIERFRDQFEYIPGWDAYFLKEESDGKDDR